MRKHSLRTFEC